eukprot:TRINITY_DN34827_c0_g1_i1.p1 TRINITY_DN34827_c0_g1~~TRINITY_DN34827_c0_g1_i1.p1  ORF type:complete len:104 (+),score=19.80 TRINITY_DN34827_c0_g1_i1:3-314(+)
MRRPPPKATLSSSSAASDVYKRQSRYSTGMMLLQPSLSTFDKMMVSLKRDVTGDMMVLPDLLFLKNFFENVMPREAKADNDALMAVYQQAPDAWRQRLSLIHL